MIFRRAAMILFLRVSNFGNAQKDLFFPLCTRYIMFSLTFVFASMLICILHFSFFFQKNAETRRNRTRATEGRVPTCDSSAIAAAASIGVESVAGAWSVQRGRQSPLPPLASRRLDSASDDSDAAAASFNPAAAAAATTTQRCAAAKSAAAVNAAALRPSRIYLDPPLVIETSKEDAMEPETKDEDERRSSTPSPEVASFLCACYRSMHLFFMCDNMYVKYSEYIFTCLGK